MRLVQEMSQSLQLPERLIQGIARKADHAYYEFEVQKRTGGTRTIHHPSKELKALQRWLLYNILRSWPVHEAAFAYRTGIGIADHARQHVDSEYLVRLDLTRFFPSIGRQDIDAFLKSRPPRTNGWNDDDMALFGRIVCRRSRLTIGAPSSPALSNAICLRLDKELAALGAELGAKYTRYADDLFFSIREPDVLWDVADRVEEVLTKLDCPGNLALNRDKTRHSSRKGRRQVTGLVITPDGQVKIGRDRKRYIRRQIYEFDNLSLDERTEVAGLIAFAIDIEPDFLNALVLKYGADRVAAARGLAG